MTAARRWHEGRRRGGRRAVRSLGPTQRGLERRQIGPPGRGSSQSDHVRELTPPAKQVSGRSRKVVDNRIGPPARGLSTDRHVRELSRKSPAEAGPGDGFMSCVIRLPRLRGRAQGGHYPSGEMRGNPLITPSEGSVTLRESVGLNLMTVPGVYLSANPSAPHPYPQRVRTLEAPVLPGLFLLTRVSSVPRLATHGRRQHRGGATAPAAAFRPASHVGR
jgi:hypothetical protein